MIGKQAKIFSPRNLRRLLAVAGRSRWPERDRLIVLLVPVIALLIPLLRIAPAIYTWRVRSKVFRCYGELKFLEEDLRQRFDRAKLPEYRNRLEVLDEEARGLHVPLAFTDLVYTLREHVNLVRHILDKKEAAA